MTVPGNAGPAVKWMLAALVGLATLYTLYLAADLLIPIFLAIFLSMLMFPLVDAGRRIRIPEPVTATLSLAMLFGLIWLAASTLSEPAEEWLAEAPKSLQQFKVMTGSTQSNLDHIRDLADEVENIAEIKDSSPAREPQEVVVREPDLLETAIVSLPGLMVKTVIVLLLAFFLVMDGRSWLLKATCLGESLAQRRRVVKVLRSIRLEISRYLITVTLINFSLGAATATFLWAMGIANPVLWGCVVALLNFAPYAGALVSTVLLTTVGFGTADSFAAALAIPGGFILLTAIEGQLVTPTVLGARMAISPAIILLSVVIGGWMWGIAGALMAVPILVSVKALSDHYAPLTPLAILLAREGDVSSIQRSRSNHSTLSTKPKPSSPAARNNTRASAG